MNRQDDSRARVELAKAMAGIVISFILFTWLWKDLKTDYYLGLYAAAGMITALLLDRRKNADVLCRIGWRGILVTAGYIAAKLAAGRRLSDLFFHGSGWRAAFCLVIALEYAALLVLYFGRRKSGGDESVELPSHNGKLRLFQEREADLERLDQYLSAVDVVGVNGEWGSGKTLLVDEYCTRNRDRYDVIEVEPLTCNLDTIDAYLFRNLEQVLWRRRIFPRYSGKLQNAIAKSGWVQRLYALFAAGDTDRLTAFQGFCQALDRMDREILLVYEDIDRISERDRGQISKIFDLSEKLLSHHVKVIYEFELSRMAEMGFGRDYLEKYIPYTLNLTRLPARKLVENGLAELGETNGGLSAEDFKFLFLPIYSGYYLEKRLGLRFNLSVHIDATPRKAKAFVTEVNTAMKAEEFARKENRQTVTAFFFMRHFFDDLYTELAFDEDFLEEVRFGYKPEKEDTVRYYSMKELAAMCRAGQEEKAGGPTAGSPEASDSAAAGSAVTGPAAVRPTAAGSKAAAGVWLTPEDVAKMFEGEEETARANRNKLALLLLLGYDFQYQQEEEAEAEMKNSGNARQQAQQRLNRRLNQEMRFLEREDRNKKVSHLIRNLYQNGRSEYTDAEAAAKTFISLVLNRAPEDWEKGWEEFRAQLYYGSFLKDNTTVFRFGGNDFVELFRALRIYVSRDMDSQSDRESVLNRALDFYRGRPGVTDDLDPEKIVILSCCEIGSRALFFKALAYFNGLTVIGNMGRERIYRTFLNDYVVFAYSRGYLTDYESWWLDLPASSDKDETDGYVREYLEQCARQLEKRIREGIYPPSVEEELKLTLAFLRKNIEILASEKRVVWKQTNIQVTMSEKTNYTNEEAYHRLEARAVTGDGAPAVSRAQYKQMLDQGFEEKQISLKEYTRLWNRFAALPEPAGASGEEK